MQRVLRYDGLLPAVMDEKGRFCEITPEHIRRMKEYIDANREETTPFDIVMEGETPGEDPQQAAGRVRPLAEAGATWWIEALWAAPGQPTRIEEVRERIRQGSPRIE